MIFDALNLSLDPALIKLIPRLLPCFNTLFLNCKRLGGILVGWVWVSLNWDPVELPFYPVEIPFCPVEIPVAFINSILRLHIYWTLCFRWWLWGSPIRLTGDDFRFRLPGDKPFVCD